MLPPPPGGWVGGGGGGVGVGDQGWQGGSSGDESQARVWGSDSGMDNDWQERHSPIMDDDLSSCHP